MGHGAVLLREDAVCALASLSSDAVTMGAGPMDVALDGSTVAPDSHELRVLLVDEVTGGAVPVGRGVATTPAV